MLAGWAFPSRFYICHPADKRCNAINQRYWLDYLPKYAGDNIRRNRNTNLIRPSANSESYAEAEGLRPFSQWIRLINADTYITGPFDFAEVNGRKTRDRVSRANWLILAKFGQMFKNEVPSMTLSEYAVHFSQFHTMEAAPKSDRRVSAYLAHPSSPSSV